MRIAIAGNIGAGKTSLTKQLSKSLKYKPYYEDVIANPYIDESILYILIATPFSLKW